MAAVLTAQDAEVVERCMAVGGVGVLPVDTTYVLACEPEAKEAVRRVFAYQGGLPAGPSPVLFFALDLALAALPELGPRTRDAALDLLPGPVTLLLANPGHRFPLACGPDPDTLALRVPALDDRLEALRAVKWPVLASPSAAALPDVPAAAREEADLVLDAGPRPGAPPTVVDLRDFETHGAFRVLEEGALTAAEVASRLGG